MKWETVALGSVAEVFNGKTPSKAEKRNEGSPVLKIKDVDELGNFRGFESFVEPALHQKYSKKSVRAGDTLVLNAAHSATHVGSKICRAPVEAIGALATGEWLMVRCTADADPGFVNHWMTSDLARRQIRDAVKGIHLYPKDVARFCVPLPPLDEQRRIAGILDAADALRRRRREALALLDTLPGAIFAEMFLSSSPGKPERPSQALGDLVDAVSGSTPSKGNKAFWDGDIPWISPKDMKTDDLDRAIINITDEATKTGKAKLVGPDVTLIVIRGMILAHSVPICDLRVPASFNQDVKALIPKKGVSNIFISAALRASKNRLLSMVSNAAHGTKRIEMGDLMKFPIPTATDAEQTKFVKAIAGAAAQRARFKGASHDGETLFASLQSRAFAGEI